MTHSNCGHYHVDEGQAYCDACMDRYYLDLAFTLNGHNYTVHQFYGYDSLSGAVFYQCRRDDGSGAIYITTEDIDAAVNG